MIQLALLPPPKDKARQWARLLLFAAPPAFGALALWLGQDANWDLRNYHWYNAYAFLNGRHGFDLLPSQTPFFYSPILDVPAYVLGQLLPARALGFILGAVQGLNFCLLFMLAHALLNIPKSAQRVGMAAALAALGMLGGGGIAQIGTTFNDNIVSLGILASLLLAATAMPYLFKLPMHQVLPRVLLYGLPAGLAIGLKLTAVFYGAGIALAWLGVGGSFRRRWQLMLAFGGGMALGVLLTQGYWMWFLWTHYDNPMFPYFNQFFRSPLAPLTSARDMQFVPGNWRDALTLPLRFAANPQLVGEIDWRDWRIPMLYLLLPLCSMVAVVIGRRRDRMPFAPVTPSRYLLWAAGLSYAGWLLLFSVYRYLVVLEMLAPMLIALCVGMLPLARQAQYLILGALLLTAAASVRPGDWGRVDWSGKFVEVTAAEIPALETATTLLMAGYEPYAHVIPSMLPSMPVIRLQSNFTNPSKGDRGMNRRIRERIVAHPGDFLLLLPSWQIPHSQDIQIALAAYNLQFNPKNCPNFHDNLGYAYAICKVQRVAPKAPDDE